jgi:hypothetical protein
MAASSRIETARRRIRTTRSSVGAAAARERRFSRFLPSSELSRVIVVPRGVTRLSEEFASMRSLALDAAHATAGLATPAAGGAIVPAGYDRDFDLLPRTRSWSSRPGDEHRAAKPARRPPPDRS